MPGGRASLCCVAGGRSLLHGRVVRHQRHVPGAFDGFGDQALVFGARSGLAARPNLSGFVDVFAKQIDLLVVHAVNLFDAELADPGAADKSTAPARLASFLPGPTGLATDDGFQERRSISVLVFAWRCRKERSSILCTMTRLAILPSGPPGSV